jgi:hypothetical protein
MQIGRWGQVELASQFLIEGQRGVFLIGFSSLLVNNKTYEKHLILSAI